MPSTLASTTTSRRSPPSTSTKRKAISRKRKPHPSVGLPFYMEQIYDVFSQKEKRGHTYVPAHVLLERLLTRNGATP